MSNQFRELDAQTPPMEEHDSVADKLHEEAYEFVGGVGCAMRSAIQQNEGLSEREVERLMSDITRNMNANLDSVRMTDSGEFIMRDTRDGTTTIVTGSGEYVRLSDKGRYSHASSGLSVFKNEDGSLVKILDPSTRAYIHIYPESPAASSITNGRIRTNLGLPTRRASRLEI